MARIMIIDDEPAMVEVISTLCRDKGHEAYPFNSAQKAMDALQALHPQLVITDLNMEGVKRRGFDVLREARELVPPPELIVITGYPDVGTAVEALTTGARDYIIKPFKIDELEVRIKNALELQEAVRENVSLKRSLKKQVENVIGNSDRMQEIYNLIGKVADTDSTILIQGESGTGKELVARALHFNSSRQHHPFVAINCSALPENLLESELFGHKKGAFTGAVQDKVGLFEEAQNGTIFLDEINSMAQQLQTKLLRVLQERQIRRVGDTKSVPINVRVLAASNEPLQEKIKTGDFREDLYYRLAVIPLEMPPLRERLEDIELLVRHFIEKNAAQTGSESKKIAPEALELLSRYRWPGNVRELENAIERACALCEEGAINVSDLPPHVVRQAHHSEAVPQEENKVPVGRTMEEFIRDQERDYIERTIKYCGGSRDKAAKMLGISMATLYRKLDVKGARAEAATA